MSCQSMTGFGQARFEGTHSRVTLELRTVNHRFSEWNVRLPRELLGLEEEIRSYLATRVARGRGDLFLTLESISPMDAEVRVDWSVLDALHSAYEQAAQRYGWKLEPTASVAQWFGFPDVVRMERKSLDAVVVRDDVFAALVQASDALVDARRREGEHLAADLRRKTIELRGIVEQLTELAPEMEVFHRDRLQHRMIEIAGAANEERLLSEVAILVDRVAIDEELVRLSSHLAEFEAGLKGGSPVGRRLDFVVQEMHREVNTIGSKATHVVVSKLVVDAKVLIEQLREQTQNVE